MINVLLADADLDNIRNFRTYIKTNHNDMRIVGTVSSDSDRILDMIRELSPRLIIADIRFFGAGGYKIIKDINSNYANVRFILYGTYQDDAYMKRCLDYGVIETIYKPVKPLELGRALSTAQAYMQKIDEDIMEENALVESYKGKMYQFAYISLTSIINGHLRDESEIQYAFNYFGFDFHSNFTVFVLRIEHFKRVILMLDEMEKHLMIYKMLLIIENKLKQYSSESIITGFHSITTILSGSFSLEDMIELWDDIKEEINHKTKLSITIGMGRTYEKATEICISNKEANAALRYRFHVGYNAVIPIHYMEPSNHITYRYPLEREERLVYTAAIGQYSYCHKLLLEIFDSLRESGELPDMLLPKIIMDIIISINRYLSENNIDLSSQFNTFFPSKEVLELKDIDSAFDFMDDALKNFCGFIVKYRENHDKKLYDAAKSYINEKFYETFSIPKIAMNVGTTSEYLSKIFMEMEKKNIFEYTLNIRMTEAKRLMRETDYDDDMVAVKVGYDDGKHFRSVFKQHEGIHTAEYRNQYSLFK